MLTLQLSDGTTTLDLMGTTYHLVRRTLNLGNPQEITAEASNIFRNGWDVVAQGFGKRTITMQLNVTGTDQAAVGTAISELEDALRKARNYQVYGFGSKWRLKVNLGGTSQDVYFNVQNGSFALSPEGLASQLLTDSSPYVLRAPLTLDVDPFGEGNEETIENYVADPSFEVAGTPLADWTEFITATMTATTGRVTTQHYYGNASLNINVTNSTIANETADRLQNVNDADAGETWSFGCWVYVPALTGGALVYFIAANIGAAGQVQDFVSAPTAGWVHLTMENVTFPIGTTGVQLACRVWNNGNAGVTADAYFDGMIAVEAAALPAAWISGHSIRNRFDDDGQDFLNYLDVEDVGGDYPAKVQFKATENEAHTKVWMGARHADRQYDGGIYHEGEDFDTWDSEPAAVGTASADAYGRYTYQFAYRSHQSSPGASAAAVTATPNIAPAGARRLLIASATMRDAGGGNAPNTVTFGAQSLTLLREQTLNLINVSIWYLVNPDAAANPVTATWAGNRDRIHVAAEAWSEVDQTSPFGDHDAATGNGVASSVTVDTETIDAVFAGCVTAGTQISAPVNITERWDAGFPLAPTMYYQGGDMQADGISETVGWNGFDPGAVDWAIIAVAIHRVYAEHPYIVTEVIATPPVGAYRVLARLRVSAREWGIAMGYGYGGVTFDPSIASQYSNPIVTIWQILDIGSLIVPPTAIPDGATIGALTLRLAIYMITDDFAATNLDVDWVMLLPVDFGSAYAAKASGADVVVVDTISKPPQLALWDGADVFQSRPEQEGVPPTVDPDGTRVYWVFDDGVDATITDGATIVTRIIRRHMNLA